MKWQSTVGVDDLHELNMAPNKNKPSLLVFTSCNLHNARILYTPYCLIVFVAALTSWCSAYSLTLSHPWTLFGDIHKVTKFRADLICYFWITVALIFRRFGLKMAIFISHPLWEFWGFNPVLGSKKTSTRDWRPLLTLADSNKSDQIYSHPK